METTDFQVITLAPMQLGECPLWHPSEEALYWIDINGQAVHRYDPKTQERATWTLPSQPGCIAWCVSGGLIVAIRSGVAFLDTRTGALSSFLDAPYDQSRFRFNDGRCDAAGRLWVGTLNEPKDGPLAALYCIERGVIRDTGVRATVSNGLGFSTDNATLFHSDTTAHQIRAFDFDLSDGTLSGMRVFREFSQERSADYPGRPDGAAVDTENCYWCAMYEGGRLVRLSSSGELLQEIQLPAKCPTMIAFGGSDLKTLFVTTARHNRSHEELVEYPLSGHVLAFRVKVAGLPEPAYIK
jgi:sugar lactone lactonase YvrE